MTSDRRWLVTGASGQLGTALCRTLVARGDRVVALARSHDVEVDDLTPLQVELTDAAAVRAAVRDAAPDHVVHAAGLTDVDACERAEALAHALHAGATATAARAAAELGATFLYVSTDHLWDGTRAMTDEATPPAPLNAYARTKLAGEHESRRHHPDALVVRTNFVGPGRPWRPAFADWLRARLAAHEVVPAFTDVWFTPLATTTLADLLVELVLMQATGTVHVAGGERISKYEFAMRLAERTGADRSLVEASTMAAARLAAPRPHDMSLSTDLAASLLGRPLPDLDDTLTAVLQPSPSPTSRPGAEQ